jgi:hypothetical protein
MKTLPTLSISAKNPHLLVQGNQIPFLMIGDTAWELFHRLDLDEIRHYLEVRASQRFNMIWANVLPEFDGLTTPNCYGHLPFLDQNPLQPVEPYFEFIDQVLELAASLGLYVGLLPTWGDKLTAPWGAGPAIFHLDNLNDAREYAAWLGARFQNQSNLIWVLGGDRPAKLFGDPDKFPRANAQEAGIPLDTDWRPIWRAMAEGLRASGAQQLVTYHPQGGKDSTSVFLHDEPWLNLNAMQSGHGGGHDIPVWDWIERDYSRVPAKPTFDAEPNYEDHPVNPWPIWDPSNGFFDDLDVRKQIYRSIFAGGCGVIYGHHCVWQFAGERHEPVLEVLFDWKTALHRPGAESLKHLVKLIESVDLLSLRPRQDLIKGDSGQGPTHARAIGSHRESLVYIPDGRPIELNLTNSPRTVEEFNPRTGETRQVAFKPGQPIIATDAKLDRVIIARFT